MVPKSLNGIYQQYKADTEIVAEWLAVTAQAHGYASPSAADGPSSRGRSKGKARKAQKARKAPAATKLPGTTGTVYIIKVSEFRPMAAFIASLPTVDIPQRFSAALERVIRVRKGFYEHLVADGVKLAGDSKGRHDFFVDVLEGVRDCLKLRMTSRSRPEKSKSSGNKVERLVNNIFGALDVYDTSEEFAAAPDVVPAPAPPASTSYVVEQDDADILMDAIFALTALLDDYRRLRAEIKSLWADYVSGHLDLAAASVATNMAIELAHAMEDEVEPMLNKEGGGFACLEQYFVAICSACGIDMECKERPGDPYNLEAYDLADACLVNSVTLLVSHMNATEHYQIGMHTYNGSFGWYDEKAVAFSLLTNRQKWNQDMTAMLEILPDLSFLAGKLDRACVVDEMIRGVASLTDGTTKSVPIWLAWATQVYLDILHSLGEDCSRGFREMQLESIKTKSAVLHIPACKQRNQVLDAAGRWDMDPISTGQKFLMDLGLLLEQAVPPFKFLRRNPMYCGLLIHNMRANLHLAGSTYAAGPGALVGVTQLYHAIRQEQLLAEDLRWDDLETLWDMQGNSAFFVGDPPSNREAYFKNYCLSIGTSASNWASNKRGGKLKIHSDNRRTLKFMGYLTLATSSLLEHPGKRPPSSSAAVRELLSEGIRRRYANGRRHDKAEFNNVVETNKLELADLPPAGLIRKVAIDIQHEAPGICFNLFTMHRKAWNFLERLQQGIGMAAGVDFPAAIAKSRDLPCMPGLVFQVASGHNIHGDRSATRSDALLNTAAQVLEEFLREGGGRAVQTEKDKVTRRDDVVALKSDGRDPWGLEPSAMATSYLRLMG